MKKKLLVFLVASFCSFSTLIQAQNESNVEPERRKWEVGLDMLAIFKLSDPQSNSKFLILRKYSQDGTKKSALELALGAYFYNSDVMIPYNNAGLNNHDYSVRFGKEYQIQEGKFMLFHGPYVSFRYNRGSGRADESPVLSTTSVTRFVSGQMGYRAGVRFFINSRFSLSTSSSFVGEFSNYFLSQERVNIITGEKSYNIVADYNQVSFNLYPITTLQLGYHF
ncbi:MAG: hypothetical protein RLZZ306_515 [Bacteroidota bacterium]|jgi:hypothetical protein